LALSNSITDLRGALALLRSLKQKKALVAAFNAELDYVKADKWDNVSPDKRVHPPSFP